MFTPIIEFVYRTVLASFVFLILAAAVALLAFAGCNRALPADEPAPHYAVAPPVIIAEVTQKDAGSSDAGLQPDMLCWDDESSAQCYPIRNLPCIHGTPSDCGYPYGEYGCPPDECRGHQPPDMWSAGCAAWNADAGSCSCGGPGQRCCQLTNAGCGQGLLCCADSETCRPNCG